jgi:glycosyltransferase involved in cell wall biosynthesis
MPNVILEGMSRGLAVIATNVGAVRALVNNENGYLIDALNEGQLRTAIEKAAAAGHQDAYEKGSKSLQMLNDRFGWDKIAEETEKQLAVRLGL